MLRFNQTTAIARLALAVRLLLIGSPLLLLAGFLTANAAVGAGLLIVAVTAAFLLDQKARRMNHEHFLHSVSSRARLRATRKVLVDRNPKVDLSADFARAQNGFTF